MSNKCKLLINKRRLSVMSHSLSMVNHLHIYVRSKVFIFLLSEILTCRMQLTFARGWHAYTDRKISVLEVLCENVMVFFSRKDGQHGKDKAEHSSAAASKPELDDGPDEVIFGKKPKLETVSAEEIK